MHSNSALVITALSLSACLSQSGRGEPLYPRMDPPPKRDEVAQLGGYVRVVDNQQVTEGKSFELLPGCHIISTPARWGRADAHSGGTMADTGHQTFALVMKPGHRYFIDVNLKMMGGSTGTVVLEAREEDPSGKRTQVFGPAHSIADIENCKQAGSGLAP
jgi:hypothetical protein